MTSRLIPRERSADWSRFEMASLSRPAPAAGDGTQDPAATRLSAEREGRAAGYAAGLAEGRAHAQRLAAVAATLSAQGAQFEERYADSMLDLVLEIARQMLRGNAPARREALLAVVREAMRALPDGLRRPQIVLHPADVELVRSQLGDELDRGQWSVVEDHRIEPGGCRLESESGDVDATLATRWKRMAASLGREGDWSAE